MQPISAAVEARGPRHEDGFALLEAVVAFAILALVAAICFPRAGAQTATSLGLLRTAAAAGALLRDARNAAVGGGRIVAVEIDLSDRSIRSGATGQRLNLADALRLDARFGDRRSRHGVVAFFPDGRSSGGRIDLGDDRSAYRITIHPQTSAVTVLPSREGAGTEVRS